MSLPLTELIKLGTEQLKVSGVSDYERDAKELFYFFDNTDAVGLMMRWTDVMQDRQIEAYLDLIARRASGEPLQYITGKTEFMGLPFKVDPRVLIPRQDTETLVEDVLSILNEGKLRGEDYPVEEGQKDVLDLCTGSGAIGISVAKLAKNVKVTASDISKDALKLAEENARENGVKVKFDFSNMFEKYAGKISKKKFDLIVSNPPYIESEVIPTLQVEVKDHEPILALDGGEDGLKFYRVIAIESHKHLEKNGILAIEIGYNQGEAVSKLLEETEKFEAIRILKDLAGLDRIVVARKKNLKK